MSDPRPVAEMPGLPLTGKPDPDFEALPAPRRPGRTLTLVTMSVTTLAALFMAWAVRGEATYALRDGSPMALGNLTDIELRADLANTWVQGEGLLGSGRAIRYGRPLESDNYRLAPIAGNEKIWVQVRVPDGLEGPRFVPPTSFVGRLVPVSSAGLRLDGLPSAVESAGAGKVPSDAWLLVDGESPQNTRWALGLILLFVSFAVFNVWGLYRLTRPVRDARA
jgi:hypothetical protein